MVSIEGAADAAKMVFQQIRPTLIRSANNPKIMNNTIELIRGFVWNRDLIVAVGSAPINDFMFLIKQSKISKDKIESFRKLFKGAFYEDTPVTPQHWEIWRQLLSSFSLYEISPFTEWMKIIASLDDRHIKSPLDLATLSYTEAMAVDTTLAAGGNVVLLWQSCLCWREKYPKGDLSLPSARLSNVQTMIQQLRVCSVEETSYYKDWVSLKSKLGLPENYDNLTPKEHIRSLGLCRADPALLLDFLRLGAKVLALRSVAGSLRSVSSGINSYASFCTIIGQPSLPPSEENVVLWGSCFRPGRTFRNYLGHLKKACLLAECAFEWYSTAVREIARGLKFAKQVSFKFPNFIYTQDLFKIINSLGWEDEFAQLAFISFLFSLRIPSEALVMKRAHRRERLEEFSPQHEQVLIGVRSCSKIDCLIVKMNRRKNLSGGCILKRACLCSDDSSKAKKICPPHRIWPIIAQRVNVGGLIFPTHTRHNINRILKFTLSKIGFKDGPKYTSKAFRRGATQELLTTGNSLEVIKGSGGWWGSGFRSYVDIEMDHAFRISRCLIALSDDSSSEDNRVTRDQADRNRRRRWRKTAAKGAVLSSASSSISSTSSGTP